MTIEKMLEEEKLTVVLGGELNTMTAPELQTAIKADLESIKNLVLDMTNLTYISSAGLRVILSARQKLGSRGDVVLVGANKEIRAIFAMTGFDKIVKLD